MNSHVDMLSAFDARTVMVDGRKLHLCLISRRSRFRAGTRYFRRGVDHDGHVANFNETEQIATVPSQSDPNATATTLSFVQIRGSIPVFWAEVNTLRYKPDLQIMDLQDSVIISLSMIFRCLLNPSLRWMRPVVTSKSKSRCTGIKASSIWLTNKDTKNQSKRRMSVTLRR